MTQSTAPRRFISEYASSYLNPATKAQLRADGYTVGSLKPTGKKSEATGSTFSSKDYNAGKNAGLKEGAKAESVRWASVMLAPEIRGKELQAATRLAALPDASSADIRAALTGCTTDAALSQARDAKAADANAASWRRAIERAGA